MKLLYSQNDFVAVLNFPISLRGYEHTEVSECHFVVVMWIIGRIAET